MNRAFGQHRPDGIVPGAAIGLAATLMLRGTAVRQHNHSLAVRSVADLNDAVAVGALEVAGHIEMPAMVIYRCTVCGHENRIAYRTDALITQQRQTQKIRAARKRG